MGVNNDYHIYGTELKLTKLQCNECLAGLSRGGPCAPTQSHSGPDAHY